jgi:hypothetical protein
MKLRSLCSILAGMSLFGTTISISPMANASENKYFCAELDGTFRAFANTLRGDIIIMNFVRNVSPQWTTQNRCLETAERLQKFHDAKTLKYIGSGKVNNSPVLCVVPAVGETCSSKNLLVTLPPKSNPIDEARKLMDTRNVISGTVVQVNGGTEKLESYVNGNIYYNLEVFEQLILNKEDNSAHLIQPN